MTEDRFPFDSDTLVVAPGRATPVEVNELAELCYADPMVQAVLEAVDSFALVINAQRQILAANPRLLEAMSGETAGNCRGLRLGEALGCVHAAEGTEGCGTSRACRHCGALLSMLLTQNTNRPGTGECLLSLRQEGQWKAREFQAHALPLIVAGHRLTLLTLQDIGAQKRRDTLERLFVHELHDSLQALRGRTELLQAAGAEATVVAEQILDLADQLTARVESQFHLLQAEDGELVAQIRTVTPAVVLDELEGSLGGEMTNRLMRLPHPVDASPLETDPELLGRILGEMVINAVEALPPGGQVTIWHERRPGQVVFCVQNPGRIPPEVADRIFQRSFSTKASRGRGLGTYRMKVLGETVLGGKVGFTTDWEEGTRFFIELPSGD